MTIGKRIKWLRRSLELTQKEFAERIGVKPNTIATYELGKSNPIDAVVSLICREFGVTETWLRTGEGDIFTKRTRAQDMEAAVNILLATEKPEFRQRLIVALCSLSDSQWDYLEGFLRSVLGVIQTCPGNAETGFCPFSPAAVSGGRQYRANPGPEPPAQEVKDWDSMTREEKIAEFTRQLDEEEKNRRQEDGPVGGPSADRLSG